MPVRELLGEDIAELLLDLNFFHKREDKPALWAIFDRLAQESEELVDDLECVQGLEAVGDPVKVTARSFERTYRFPPQETKLRAGRKPCIKPAAMPEDVDLREIDHEKNLLVLRSEEHTSELQSLMRISYAVFCLKKKQQHHTDR